MKLKIRNILNQITPKIIEGVRRSVFSLSIKDKIQYQVIPLQIAYPKIVIESQEELPYNIILGSWFEIPNSSSLSSIVPFVWVSYNDIFDINNTNTPIESASAVRSRLDGISAGRRFLAPRRYWGARSFWGATSDNIPVGSIPGITNVTPWADTAIKGITTEWNSWLDSLGTTFDFLIMDQENQYVISSYDGITFAKKLNGLTGDPRYTQAKYGLSSLSDLLSGISLNNVTNLAYSSGMEYITFNKVIGQYGGAVLNRALWDYSKQKLPNLRGSNYDGFISTVNPAPDLNGHPQSYDNIFGTASAPNMYAMLGQINTAWYINKTNPTQLIFRYTAPAEYNSSDLVPQTVWSGLIQSQQLARSIRRSDPTKGFQPWIASPGYTGDSVDFPVLFSTDDRYYYENIIHLGLLGAEAYLYWNPSEHNGLSLTYATKINSTINELNTRFGNKRIKETVPSGLTSISWNANLITTGARLANNTYLWRTTFKPGSSVVTDTSTNVQYILGSEVGLWKTTANNTPPQYQFSNSLLFYDGITGDGSYNVTEGRRPFPEFEALGARYMPFIQMSDSYYLDPTRTAGWTSGSPFYYITSKEIPFLVQSLVEQGLTASSKSYVYVNWLEGNREFILYNGYTGPADATAASEHTLLSKTMAKLLVGGTGIDGSNFFGLKHYFPGVSWGFYNEPPWPYYFGNDVYPPNIWNQQNIGGITAIMNHAADVFLSATDLVDAIDMLMPSLYSAVNAIRMNKLHSEQAVRLCKIINEKLVQQGKQPKLIIPFISPIYNTEATGTPYTINNYEPTFPNDYYIPPNTVMLDNEIQYEQIDPIIQNGGDGATIWVSAAYREKQIAGRAFAEMDEDVPLGAASWRFGPIAGVTNPWSYKSTARQAISAYHNYISGVCMGITGPKWWWQAGPSTEIYTPTEWLPLSTNKVYPAAGATSGATASAIIENILEDTKRRTINVFIQAWNNYYNG